MLWLDELREDRLPDRLMVDTGDAGPERKPPVRRRSEDLLLFSFVRTRPYRFYDGTRLNAFLRDRDMTSYYGTYSTTSRTLFRTFPADSVIVFRRPGCSHRCFSLDMIFPTRLSTFLSN
jgi:hypothetical protein